MGTALGPEMSSSEAGTLTIMPGGPAALVARARIHDVERTTAHHEDEEE
jgi:hypothetical protein